MVAIRTSANETARKKSQKLTSDVALSLQLIRQSLKAWQLLLLVTFTVRTKEVEV